MAISLSKLVLDYLTRNAGTRLTVGEIALALSDEHPARFKAKREKLGSKSALVTQVTREIYGRRAAMVRQFSQILTDASRSPIRLFVEAADELEVVSEPTAAEIISAPDENEAVAAEQRREHGLYAPLQAYLAEAHGVVSKRIRESTSSNRRGRYGNRWLHPDIVGMMTPGLHWEDLVRQCSSAMPMRKAKLVSVEVKLALTASTVRASFFQAASNSLWANRAYLAATEVRGEDTLEELTVLCSLHGVGYIAIDPDNASESRILIPAREREEVDWASANRIAKENADFRAYLQQVLNYLHTGQVVHQLWDGDPVGA
ncbi:hypothetical protein [Phenylobacterium sp.]|uniref:hypothetical protein n=1 Tax=Phenylobacterium sp. TaxID=1871053 RepID=UPI002FCB9971